ncbi:MAG: hypothetical protein JO217_08320, partial [Acidobacteriaceae bacterium]|nr:hypothetical protein [Acidobacteriaceae bacterium]
MAEILRDWYALNAGYSHIRISEIQREFRICTGLGRWPLQIFEGSVDNQLASFRASGKLAGFGIDIEKPVLELTNFHE